LQLSRGSYVGRELATRVHLYTTSRRYATLDPALSTHQHRRDHNLGERSVVGMKIFSFGRLVTLGVDVALGCDLGNREGGAEPEEAARQAQRTVQEFLSDPKTQRRVHETASTVTDTIKEKPPALGGVAEKAADLLDKTTGYDSDETLGHANSPTADPENDKAGHKT